MKDYEIKFLHFDDEIESKIKDYYIYMFMNKINLDFYKKNKVDILALLILANTENKKIMAYAPIYTENVEQIENKETALIGYLNAASVKEGKYLLENIENYLYKFGFQKIVTPIERNTWNAYRIKTTESISFPGEPRTDAILKECYTQLNYNQEYKYHSYIADNRKKQELKPITNTSIEIITLEEYMDNKYGNLMEELYELSIQSFKNNLFYGHIEFNDFKAQYEPLIYNSPLKPIVYLSIDKSKNNKLIGYILGYPTRDDKYFVMKTIAVDENYRGEKIGANLFFTLTNKALDNGYKKILPALVYEKNISNYLFKKYENVKCDSEYILFSKELKNISSLTKEKNPEIILNKRQKIMKLKRLHNQKVNDHEN